MTIVVDQVPKQVGIDLFYKLPNRSFEQNKPCHSFKRVVTAAYLHKLTRLP
ncbi:MAG: hypothetical protein HC840_12380 [Leptolyngbyaceae cyanobacterium RM2_2_4]|nr:hypothetical protein [Leptolyngbyaceae cyanobacterium SM1_4_3]NJN89361.1 hypothetical protein [Leptolyngbyaceae cyanobacterium SL_5_14]NJO50093.1 hypothetical protein [Leptolyngbyaceae cyanobacterium RM2_2_4]